MRLKSLTASIVAIAALAAAFAFSTPAEAQDESYIDLSVEITVTDRFTFTARNLGTAIAYGVSVDIELADQIIHAIEGGQLKQKSGTTCSGDIPGTTCVSRVWTLGAMEPGVEVDIDVHPRLASGLPCCMNVGTKWTVPTRAVIKNTVPQEEERFEGNNTTVGWISVSQSGSGSEVAEGRYWLEASVDDLLPEAGDTVKFSFDIKGLAGYRDFIRNTKVRLRLDDGLGTPTASVLPTGTTFAAARGLVRTWDWNSDTLPAPLEVSTTLDNPLPVGVARSDLCLTAELTAHPDNIGVVGRVTYTSAEICLREDPVTLLQTGQTHLFTVYPCVGVSNYPCSSSDTVEMVVNGGASARAAGIARDDAIMAPGNVIVQVKDPEGRAGTGSNLSWGSADAGLSTSIDNSRLSLADWTHWLWKIVPVQLPTGGNLSITPDANRSFAYVHTETKAQHPPGGLTTIPSQLIAAVGTYIKFESLGTYIVDFTQETTHNNGTPSNTTDDVNYSATGRYTFHVGPVVELEVQDGGSNPDVPLGRRAFTIRAINNGPDDAPAVQVAVTGLNARDYVSHSATAGIFDSDTGVWTIGEMREPVSYQDIYGRDWDELTIITRTAADTEITATISSAQDYQVCIDSSGDDVDLSSPSETACTTEDSTNTWHTAEYFDYISDNDSAVIAARAGLEGGATDTRPGMVSALPMGGANLVYWSEPLSGGEHRHFGPVRFWDIEYSDDGGSNWVPLRYRHSRFGGSHYYVDRDAPADSTRRYRVRAHYDQRAGEWTEQGESVAQTTASGDPGVSINPTDLTVREGSRVSYSVRLDARPTGDVVIDAANSNPDVQLSADRLTFTPSNWSRAQTVSVTARRDSDTADDTDTITHVIDQDATGALEYRGLGADDVSVTIDDRDVSARFTVGRSGVTSLTVDEGGKATYELSLGTRPQQDVDVSLSYPSGIIEVSPRNLTFTPENYNVSQTITVTGVQDDDTVDNDLGFIAHSFSGGYADDAWLNVTVVDDDRTVVGGVGGEVELALSGYCPGTWPEELTGARIEVTGYPEEVGGCFYQIRLNAAPTGNVTVRLSTDRSKVELDADPWTEGLQDRITFTLDNWRDAKEVGFWPIHDPDGVHNNDFTITHTASGGGYNGVRIPAIHVGITDADRDQIGFRVEGPHGGVAVREGDRGTSDEDLYQAAFYMFPGTQPMSTVTVSMSSDNPDVTLSPSRLSFTRANWDQGHYEGYPGKRVVVRAAHDSDEEDETATITFTVASSDADYNGLTLETVPVRVEDDDKPEAAPPPPAPAPAPAPVQANAPAPPIPVVSIATSSSDGVGTCGTWQSTSEAPHHAVPVVALPGEDQVVGCDQVVEGRAAAFSILLSGTTTQDVRVPVVVEDVAGSNFLHRDVEGCNVVRVPAGTQSVQLVIPTRDDANDEADGSIWARLGDSFLSLFLDVPDRAGYELASDGMEVQVSVVDNDDSGTAPVPPPSSNRCRALN